MKIKPIILVAGEPNSIFFEIFLKSIKIKKFKSPLVLICCKKVLQRNMKILKFKKDLRFLNYKNLHKIKLDNKKLNIINIDLIKDSAKGQENTKKYIKECFKIAFKLIKKKFSRKLINGPINKKNFLNKKFLGITEYVSDSFNKKKFGMLIFNKNLSVCPLTTHLPLSLVAKNINKKEINEKVFLIDQFFRKNFGFRPKIGITGLNPHCESILKFNEDVKIIAPAIKLLKKRKYRVSGPFAADTIFLKKNRDKYDVILGMYHDQVLAPIKTLFEYDAINITMGLPFLRVTPDHGPNQKMVGKNLSNPRSLINALNFLDQR